MNAVGTTSAATNIAAIATSIAANRASSSASMVFVSHAYAAHDHQSAPSRSSARQSPCQVGSSARNVVTSVNPNTNTKSKNSSSGVTRCSPAAAPWYSSMRGR